MLQFAGLASRRMTRRAGVFLIAGGVALLPAGSRRRLLSDLAEAMFQEDFSDRCLAFDCSAATHYAAIVASRTHEGRPVSVEDAQIAAIALTAGLSLATRNTKDFKGIDGLVLVDPWNDRAPPRSSRITAEGQRAARG